MYVICDYGKKAQPEEKDILRTIINRIIIYLQGMVVVVCAAFIIDICCLLVMINYAASYFRL